MNSKKEIVFISVPGGNGTMDELKEKNCVNKFLTKVGRWMNFGNLT
jgi:predicted Rossmann-fold nucleotide-binding protein